MDLVKFSQFGDLDIAAKGLLKEVMLDFEQDQHESAKNVIKERLLEIQRLEFLLEKAKADLGELLKLSQAEILMQADSQAPRQHRRLHG